MAPALAEHFRELFLRVPEAIHELTIAKRLLDRIEVRALDVLDDRELEHFGIAELSNDAGKLVLLRNLGCAPAPFARDDLKFTRPILQGPQDQRLDHTLLADRVGKILQILLVEGPPGLVGIGMDAFDRDHPVGRHHRTHQ